MRRRREPPQDTAPYEPEKSRYGGPEDDQPDYGQDPENEELEDTHRFHIAMGVFNLISILAGLAVILVLVAILVSLVTWLQSDITQSMTLLTSNIK
ncbi:MAG TPA: hypothetical protein PKN45_05645 [Candidatus Limiplasma sp.]|jgi:hypothetical protein|nr:hypothetical protein [Candidatus Limiplasma sp.]